MKEAREGIRDESQDRYEERLEEQRKRRLKRKKKKPEDWRGDPWWPNSPGNPATA